MPGMFAFEDELNGPEEAVDFPAFPQYSDDDEASTDGTAATTYTVSLALQSAHPLSIDGSLHEETTVRQVACSLPVDMPFFARTKQDSSGQSVSWTLFIL